jgi:hypothetical protein
MYSETTEDVSDKIERDAKAVADQLQQSIDKESKEVSGDVMEIIDGFEMDF